MIAKKQLRAKAVIDFAQLIAQFMKLHEIRYLENLPIIASRH